VHIVDIGAYELPQSGCSPTDIAPNPCGDGTTGIQDLLLVIASWGPCDANTVCIADIVSPFSEVGVADLLAVITGWGACMSPGQLPASLSDCYDLADETCEESEDPDCWYRIYSGCVEYLCQEDIITCD
jgi:hypothetical protein